MQYTITQEPTQLSLVNNQAEQGILDCTDIFLLKNSSCSLQSSSQGNQKLLALLYKKPLFTELKRLTARAANKITTFECGKNKAH